MSLGGQDESYGCVTFQPQMRLHIHDVYFWPLADIAWCVRNPPQPDLITVAMVRGKFSTARKIG